MSRYALVVLMLITASTPAAAAERTRAQVVCKPAGERFAYLCTAMLIGRKSGKPVVGAVGRANADMPSMPMAHNVRPVPLKPGDKPGVYNFRLALEMYGLWTVKLRMSKPARDIIIVRLRFTDSGGYAGGLAR